MPRQYSPLMPAWKRNLVARTVLIKAWLTQFWPWGLPSGWIDPFLDKQINTLRQLQRIATFQEDLKETFRVVLLEEEAKLAAKNAGIVNTEELRQSVLLRMEEQHEKWDQLWERHKGRVS